MHGCGISLNGFVAHHNAS